MLYYGLKNNWMAHPILKEENQNMAPFFSKREHGVYFDGALVSKSKINGQILMGLVT